MCIIYASYVDPYATILWKLDYAFANLNMHLQTNMNEQTCIKPLELRVVVELDENGQNVYFFLF